MDWLKLLKKFIQIKQMSNNFMEAKVDKYSAMRPKDLYGEILKQRKNDGINFMREYGNEFEDINCPACDSNKSLYIFEKWGYTHKTCSKCNTLYCSTRPNEELLKNYYNNYKSPKMWTDLLLKANAERKKIQYEPRINKIIQMIPDNAPKNIAIDIGAGSGVFACTLKETNKYKKVIALDFSEDCIDRCKEHGLDVIQGGIASVEGLKVDLLTMNDLIEHVYSPIDLLSKCYSVLNKGGYIQIATPNCMGLDFLLLGKNTGNIVPPEHLNYFNTNSIVTLLNRVGFKDVYVETPGILDVNIVKEAINEGLDLSIDYKFLNYIFNSHEEIHSQFQNFLRKAKLSSHMLIMAKK